MVRINKASSKPYYEQLVLSIKEDILNGVLTAGDQVPSVREMAKHLLMNPNTVSKAYKVLENEQVLVTIKGKGTFVKVTEDLPRDEIRILQVKEDRTCDQENGANNYHRKRELLLGKRRNRRIDRPQWFWENHVVSNDRWTLFIR